MHEFHSCIISQQKISAFRQKQIVYCHAQPLDTENKQALGQVVDNYDLLIPPFCIYVETDAAIS
jgi:hypothetical protein